MEGQEKGANVKDRTRHAEGASVLKSLSSQLSAAGVSAVLTIKSPPFKNTSLASYIEKMLRKHFPDDKDGEQGVSTQRQVTWEVAAGRGAHWAVWRQ